MKKIYSNTTKLNMLEFPYTYRHYHRKHDKRMTIEQIYQYIKTGTSEDLDNLDEYKEEFKMNYLNWMQNDLVWQMPGVAFSYCFSEECSWPEYFAFSGLIAFEFHINSHEDYDELKRMARDMSRYTLLRYYNLYRGLTLVINVNPISGGRLDYPFDMINKFFKLNYGFTAEKFYQGIHHLTVLAHDDEAILNTNAISFFHLIRTQQSENRLPKGIQQLIRMEQI